MWLKRFKLAVFEENPERIEALLDEMPQFETTEAMEEAAYLMLEAAKIIKKRRDETAVTLSKMKQNLQFLTSTQTDKNPSIDLTL